jgi:hypothetical protein
MVNVEYIFWEGNRYTNLVQEQFAEKFPETPAPHRSAVRRLEKFCETGSVLDTEQIGRPSKVNDNKLMDISDFMLQSPASRHKRKILGLQQRIKWSKKNCKSSHKK